MRGESFDEREEVEYNENDDGEPDDELDRDDLSVISNVSDRKFSVNNDPVMTVFDDDNDDNDENEVITKDLLMKHDQDDELERRSKRFSFKSPLEAHQSFMRSAKEKDTLSNLKAIGAGKALYMKRDEYGFDASALEEGDEDEKEDENADESLGGLEKEDRSEASVASFAGVKLPSFYFLSALTALTGSSSTDNDHGEDGQKTRRGRKKKDKTLAAKPLMAAVDKVLQVLFPPPEDPPIPVPPDKLRKQQLTLQNVFDAGELLHANIDPNTQISDLQFRQLLGLPETDGTAEQKSKNDRSGSVDEDEEGDDEEEEEEGQGQREQDTAFTPARTVSSLGSASSSSSFAILNSSVKDRHSGGVLQHHFYSPSSQGKDTQDTPLRLPVIARPPPQTSDPPPLYHKALDQSTREYLAGLGDDSGDGSAAVSSSARARILAAKDLMASSPSVASSITSVSPRLALRSQSSSSLPPLHAAHSVGSGGGSATGEDAEDHPNIVFQHSTNSYIDAEMSRDTANQAKYGMYQRAYNVEDLVAHNWQAFSHRHLAAIEANTTGNCPPAIFIPHGAEEVPDEKDGGDLVADKATSSNSKARKTNDNEDGNNGDNEEDDDEEDEFSKLGLGRDSPGLQAGVVLAAASYPDVWGVLTSPCPKYPHISSLHPSLPTTLSASAFFNSTPQLLEAEAKQQRKKQQKEQLQEQQKVASVALQVKREEKAARDRLLQKLHSRWTGDREGDVAAASRVKKYVQQSQQEEKQILDEYLQAMDDW